MNPDTITKRTVPVNDIEMYFEVRGSGEPLVLLHGFSGLGRDWELIFEEPTPGYTLIAPDLRGHGRSTNPAGVFTFQQAALDVLALLDRLGIEKFKGMGVSGGANTLLHVATQQPWRVEAMVLVSGAQYYPAEVRTLMAQMAPENHTPEEWKFMRTRHARGDDQIRALWEQCCAFKDNYDDMNFTIPYLSTIQARTLILYGDRDPLYPVEMAVEMYRAIPRSYLWVVPNAGHGPIFGDLSQEMAERALAFLTGASAPAGAPTEILARCTAPCVHGSKSSGLRA
jgi:pimeloyl-ACP methyl ester carboxylesterase